MFYLNKETLANLGEQQQKYAVSIYISAYRKNKSHNSRIDISNQVRLKNQIKAAEDQLKESGMNKKHISQYLEPVKQLLEDKLLLNNLWDGLAVFLNDEVFEYYKVPDLDEDFTYVNNEFYLLPLFRPVKENMAFYILSLSLHGVQLFRADRFNILELGIEKYVPQVMEEVLGFDYKNEIFQQKGAYVGGGKISQGHFRGDEEKKKEVEAFIRYVDTELMKIIKSKELPLIVASVDYIFSMFKSISNYKHVWQENISLSPKRQNPNDLKNEAWAMISNSFEEEKEKAIKQYHESKEKSDMAEEIIPFSIEGKTNKIFVKKGQSLWGKYNPQNNTIKVHDQKQPYDKELLNFAALNTYLNNGEVILLEDNKMPQPEKSMTVTCRY